MTNAAPKVVWTPQPSEERAKDLERAAAAIRYALEPGQTVPVIVKPIGAAQALAAIRNADPSLLEWETKAQDATAWVAAVEVAKEMGAPASVLQVLNEKLAASESALATVKVSDKFGAKHEILDFIAALQERAHPQPPR